MKRREFISGLAGVGAAALSLGSCSSSNRPVSIKEKSAQWQLGRSLWPVCLDTATLSGDIPLERKVELAAEAGFDAIEPWDRELQKHLDDGKSLRDLAKKIKDLGLFVPSVIGLWGALAPNKELFEKNLDKNKHRMQMVSDLGSKHIQVIPQFSYKQNLDHYEAAKSYSKICDLAKVFNLQPGIIFLNFVKGLEQMADAVHIAHLSGESQAQVILDTYHMFLGGSAINNLRQIPAGMISIFQFADAGHDVEPTTSMGIDGKRVLPGDGKLPLVDYLRPLKEMGYDGCVSLELYNREYRKREPKAFLAEALEKTVNVIERV